MWFVGFFGDFFFFHSVLVKEFLCLISLAFGVAHQAVEEVNPGGDTVLVQG